MYATGTPVVCENEPDVKLYVIRRGRATITDGELGEVAELEAGQFFGELALTGRKHRRAAGVIASRHSEGLLLVSLALATVRTNPKLANWIASLDAIAETEAQKEMAKRGPPRGHVALAPWPSSKRGFGAGVGAGVGARDGAAPFLGAGLRLRGARVDPGGAASGAASALALAASRPIAPS